MKPRMPNFSFKEDPEKKKARLARQKVKDKRIAEEKKAQDGRRKRHLAAKEISGATNAARRSEAAQKRRKANALAKSRMDQKKAAVKSYKKAVAKKKANASRSK